MLTFLSLFMNDIQFYPPLLVLLSDLALGRRDRPDIPILLSFSLLGNSV